MLSARLLSARLVVPAFDSAYAVVLIVSGFASTSTVAGSSSPAMPWLLSITSGVVAGFVPSALPSSVPFGSGLRTI